MKLISWNVNGIRAVERKGELQSLVNSETPDLLLLQEIKGNAEQFSKYLRENPDYQQHYHSAEKKGYAGTAVWARNDFVESILVSFQKESDWCAGFELSLLFVLEPTDVIEF